MQLTTYNLQTNANLTFNNASIATLIAWFLYTSANQHMTPNLTSIKGSKPYLCND